MQISEHCKRSLIKHTSTREVEMIWRQGAMEGRYPKVPRYLKKTRGLGKCPLGVFFGVVIYVRVKLYLLR